MSKTVVDRVHRHPNQAIRVTIIGAGVAGLQAALECWRKGCEVVVLERVTELSPVGMRVRAVTSSQFAADIRQVISLLLLPQPSRR
jgi:NADPH-dependent 2,4-dienoyl-CoA reductase/sulfur reductase-like enzyme